VSDVVAAVLGSMSAAFSLAEALCELLVCPALPPQEGLPVHSHSSVGLRHGLGFVTLLAKLSVDVPLESLFVAVERQTADEWLAVTELSSAHWYSPFFISVQRIDENTRVFHFRVPHRREPPTTTGLPRSMRRSTCPHGSS